MKVKLTLKRGSFYFMKNVHLLREVPAEVDLTTLTKVELSGLKLNIKGGTILADKDISAFGVECETPEPLPVNGELEVASGSEVVEPLLVSEHPLVEAPQTEEEYLRTLSNRELKEKLTELGVEPTSNKKDDLIAQILEASKVPEVD